MTSLPPSNHPLITLLLPSYDAINLSLHIAYFEDMIVGAVCCRVDTVATASSLYIMTLGCLAPYRRTGVGMPACSIYLFALSERYVCLYVCLSVCLSVRPSVRLSVCLSRYIYIYIYLYIYLDNLATYYLLPTIKSLIATMTLLSRQKSL